MSQHQLDSSAFFRGAMRQALKDLNLNDKYFMSLLLPMEEVDFITCEVTSREDVRENGEVIGPTGG